MQDPVEAKIVEELTRKFTDFRRAYTKNGLTTDESDRFGATRRTLRQFAAACKDLNALVRDVMIPNPAAAWQKRTAKRFEAR